MRTAEELKRRKIELKLTYGDLSAATGIPVPTLQKIFTGKTNSPGYMTMQKLEKVLFGSDTDKPYTSSDITAEEQRVRETQPAYHTGSEETWRRLSPYVSYKPQGTYTVSDLEQLPEEERFELIDGVLIRMEAPSREHQLLVSFITGQLSRLAEEQADCDCLVLCSPFDVQLDRDERTMVQPDVLVICDEKNVNEKQGIGAPDLCVEILSSSTRNKDQLLKKYKYEQAGVREFWIVDPEAEQVIVYRFEDSDGGKTEQRYSFEDKVPVGICGREHFVDFSKRIPAFIRRRMKSESTGRT